MLLKDQEATSVSGVRKLWQWLVDFSPCLCVGLVLQVNGIFYEWLRLRSEPSAIRTLRWVSGGSFEAAAADFTSRFSLGVGASAQILLVLVLVGATIHLWLSMPRLGRAWRWVLALLAAALCGRYVWESAAGKTHVLVRFPRELLESAATELGMQHMLRVEQLVSGCIMSGLVLLVAIFSTVLLGTRRDETPDGLRLAYRQVQRSLYLVSALLVLSVFFYHILLRWPAAFLEPEAAATLRQLATAYAAVTGLYWTLALLGAYLPTHYLLQTRSWRLAARQLQEKPVDIQRQWLEEKGLLPPLRRQLTYLVSALGPLLAGGPGAVFLGLLTG